MSDIYKFNQDEILSPDEEIIHDQNKTIKRLQERLKIYEKAMERTDGLRKCLNQEGQIKRLQEQLKEANYVISIYRCFDDTEYGRATEYCKKWGVK